jgi:hypothetical protein
MNVYPPQQQLAKVNIHEILEKFQSKKELFNFLVLECEAYLPKMDSINIFFLREILRGEKEVSDYLDHYFSISSGRL